MCFNFIDAKNQDVDWMSAQEWSYFPGAEVVSDGVRIMPINREISHKDTSKAQPNPPVNVRSSSLQVSGDFNIEAQIYSAKNGAVLQFYGRTPVIYDEWRQERASVRLELNKESLSVRIWDGTAANSIDERTYILSVADEDIISISKVDDEIIINHGAKTLGTMPAHNIFKDGTIWFGADAKPGTDGWILKSLRARSLGKGSVDVIASLSSNSDTNKSNSLRNLATAHSRQLPIGAAIAVYPLFTDENYRSIALDEFSMMTLENSMKPQAIHPGRNLYTFQEADSMVATALTNKMLVHGHALVMPKANPQWMQDTTEAERQQVMIEHINSVVGHYKGKVAQWDVVNEPLSEDDIDYFNENLGLRSQIWFDAMGEAYIDVAFHTARAADPTAKLFINEFGLEKDGKRWEALIALIKRLQVRGVPIDGVGFEAHVYHEPDFIDPNVLRRHIQQLASLGVVSRISEIDVLGDEPTMQASQYSEVLKVCLSEPTCTSYGVWGITDLYGSTTLSDRYPIKLGDSLLWGSDYTPKPALNELQKVLSNY